MFENSAVKVGIIPECQSIFVFGILCNGKCITNTPFSFVISLNNIFIIEFCFLFNCGLNLFLINKIIPKKKKNYSQLDQFLPIKTQLFAWESWYLKVTHLMNSSTYLMDDLLCYNKVYVKFGGHKTCLEPKPKISGPDFHKRWLIKNLKT